MMPAMRAFLRSVPVSLLAAYVGEAAAADLSHDVITLTTGERLVGELVDVRDGRYWMLLTDGRMVSAEFRTATRVEMGGASTEPVPIEELPLPEWAGTAYGEENRRAIAGGLDFGLTQGARIRFRTNSPAVAHVDIKAGLSLALGSGVGFALLTGTEVAFFGNSPVHLTLSGGVGPAILYGSLYGLVGVGTGLQVDPKGPVEVHIGFLAGTNFNYFTVCPDLTVSWVW
jgi:hypothetical protein